MLPSHTHLLLAVDVNGLLSILFILFSLIVYVINQVAAKGQDAAKNQPRPRPAPPSADPTEDEIEAFLRRATRKREGDAAGRGQQQRQQASGQPGGQPFGGQQRQGQRGPQRSGSPGRTSGRPSQGMPSQNMPSQMTIGPQTPVQGRVVQPPAAKSSSLPSSLSEQLEQRSGLSSLAEAGSKFPTLHSSLEQIDEAAEARLHSTFDHALGSLGGGLLSTSDDDRIYGSTITDSSGQAQPEAAPQNSIVDMIRSPQGIRNAIIMQEILRPRSEL